MSGASAACVTPARIGGVLLELHHARRVDRRGDRIDVTMGQDVDVIDAVRIECRNRAATGSPEAGHCGPEPAAVFAGPPGELQGVQHRAVTGHFVILMKDVQAERTVSGPVVHGFEGDQRQPPLDAQLGDCLVLDAMRPPPQDLPVSHLLQVRQLRLRQQEDIAFREELRTCPQPRDVWPELLVGHAETLTVTTLKVDAIPKVSGDPLDVQRMDREPPLALLPRPRNHSQGELIHARSLARTLV